MGKGTEFLRRGQFEKSPENFEKALKDNPRRKLVFIGKGLCLMNLGRY